MLEEQGKFKNEIAKFKESSKPKALNNKISWTFENAHKLLSGRQNVIHGFKCGILSKINRHKERASFRPSSRS